VLNATSDLASIGLTARHDPPTVRPARSFACITALAAVQFAFSMPVFAQSLPAPKLSTGALLYETHCIGCHSKQIHWRERKLATDWVSLVAQVRRWQANIGLQWTNDEIDEVTRYLNRTIYMFPEDSTKRVG
jgi:mono/diheme cytochrome c family protein